MDLVHDLDDFINRFRCKIKEGPYYMFVIDYSTKNQLCH